MNAARRFASRVRVMHMRWRDLAFFHWPIDAEPLRQRLPPAIRLDTFGGQAWIGVTPFQMTAVRPAFIPPLPGISAFPEINVRTYVISNGVPGIWFFALDAAQALAVRAARLAFNLPYHHARISMETPRGGRSLAQRALAKWRSSGRVLRKLPAHRRLLLDKAGRPRSLAHRTLLPLFGEPGGQGVSAIDRSPEMATAARGRRDRGEHHVSRRASAAGQRSSIGAFRERARRLGPSARKSLIRSAPKVGYVGSDRATLAAHCRSADESGTEGGW